MKKTISQNLRNSFKTSKTVFHSEQVNLALRLKHKSDYRECTWTVQTTIKAAYFSKTCAFKVIYISE